MTAQAELTLLETAYEAILTGGVSSYSVNGRSLTKLDLAWIASRMDTLRAQVARETRGSFFAASFRKPE